MSEFYVGQKVVCVDDACVDRCPIAGYIGAGDLDGLTAGKLYTVSQVRCGHGHEFIAVSEIIRAKPTAMYDDAFSSSRFRPIEYKSMSIFRAIAADPTRKLEDA